MPTSAELFLVKRALGASATGSSQRVSGGADAVEQPLDWRQLAKKYSPYMGGGALEGLGGAAVGKALFGTSGGAAIGGLAGAGLGAYLGHRYRKGHFDPLMGKGGLTMQNLGKALWSQ